MAAWAWPCASNGPDWTQRAPCRRQGRGRGCAAGRVRLHPLMGARTNSGTKPAAARPSSHPWAIASAVCWTPKCSPVMRARNCLPVAALRSLGDFRWTSDGGAERGVHHDPRRPERMDCVGRRGTRCPTCVSHLRFMGVGGNAHYSNRSGFRLCSWAPKSPSGQCHAVPEPYASDAIV